MGQSREIKSFASGAPNGQPIASMSVITDEERDLLCALGYVYLACGQASHAVALLRPVDGMRRGDVGLLRILGYSLIANGEGEEALAVIDRLEALDDKSSSRTPLMLLRSFALHLAGQMDQAKDCFRRYVALRKRFIEGQDS